MREVNFYTDADERCAAEKKRKCILVLAALMLPFVAAYVAAVVARLRLLMLAASLAGLAAAVMYCDFQLIPALCYASFLKAMKEGLRRSADCVILGMEASVQKQDGVRVHELHVRLCEGEDSRVFYVNVSKADSLPEAGVKVRLVSYGRHMVGYEPI